MELISQADWVIDMGPDGGSEGGEVLFSGTPDKLMSCPDSKTGRYLKMAVFESMQSNEKLQMEENYE
ncbi:UvrABC system protein A [compost metagenome]